MRYVIVINLAALSWIIRGVGTLPNKNIQWMFLWEVKRPTSILRARQSRRPTENSLFQGEYIFIIQIFNFYPMIVKKILHLNQKVNKYNILTQFQTTVSFIIARL